MKQIIYSLLALVIITASCQPKKETAKDKDEFADQTKKIEDAVMATAPDLPPPDEFAARLQATGADYFESVINDPANAEKYLNAEEGIAAANIGVYFADLAYTSAYRESETSFKLLQSLKILSERLGIEQSIVNSIMERYSEYVEIPDSVKAYLQEFNAGTTDNLMDMGRGKLAGAIYTGFFFEGLHMALAIIENYPDDLPEDVRVTLLIPVYRAVLEEQENVTKIKKFLESVSGPNSGYFLQAVTELEAIYMELDVAEKIRNNQLMELKGDLMLDKLTDKIEEIRMAIVK